MSEVSDKQADLNFIKAARESAAVINSAKLQTELNKRLVRIALPNDDLTEKIDKELSKAKGKIGATVTK